MNITKTETRINTHISPTTDEQLQAMFNAETERFADEMMDSICSSPIGSLLHLISHLPEIRQEKVTHARQEIEKDGYDRDQRLDAVIDQMLEELITEN